MYFCLKATTSAVPGTTLGAMRYKLQTVRGGVVADAESSKHTTTELMVAELVPESFDHVSLIDLPGLLSTCVMTSCTS